MFRIRHHTGCVAFPQRAIASERLETRILFSYAWNIVPSPNPLDSRYDPLNGVVAISDHEVWAVGANGLQSSGGYDTLAERWNGSRWGVVPTPNTNSTLSLFNAVAAVSSNDIWAVGHAYGATGQTLIEHWNGTSWSIVASPNPGSNDNELFGVTAISANDVWAVGVQQDSSLLRKTLIEHWDGSAWSVVPSPSPAYDYNYLRAVGGSGSNDVWAVGAADHHSSTLVEHWDGHSWSIVPSPSGGYDATLYALTLVSPTNVWAVGSGQLQTLAQHWNGTTWSTVPIPSPGTNSALTGLTARGDNDLWAVGSTLVQGTPQSFTEHWDGSNWSIVNIPGAPADTELNAVSSIRGGTVWAVGLNDQDTFTARLIQKSNAMPTVNRMDMLSSRSELLSILE